MGGKKLAGILIPMVTTSMSLAGALSMLGAGPTTGPSLLGGWGTLETHCGHHDTRLLARRQVIKILDHGTNTGRSIRVTFTRWSNCTDVGSTAIWCSTPIHHNGRDYDRYCENVRPPLGKARFVDF